MSCRSRAISLRSCSRLGGLVADLTVAIVSRPISNGPPGSASEMAIPATNGARRILIHSSSGNASFVVTVAPLLSLVANIREVTTARPRRGSSARGEGQAVEGGELIAALPPIMRRPTVYTRPLPQDPAEPAAAAPDPRQTSTVGPPSLRLARARGSVSVSEDRRQQNAPGGSTRGRGAT